MVILRRASNTDHALRVANAMEYYGLTIVAIVADLHGQYHVFGRAKLISEECKTKIDLFIGREKPKKGPEHVRET